MNTRVLVFLAVLVGIGTVLHAVMPPLFLGMQLDMLLVMMFLGIMLFPERKNVFVLSVTMGIIAALTTKFPGGQIPNLIDKPITAFIVFGLFLALRNFSQNATVTAAILAAVGTMISGTIFLTSALLLVGLPGGAPFMALFTTVVLPTTVINTIAIIVIYPVVKSILKRSKITAETN